MLEGLPPNGATTVLRLVCSEAVARAAADLVVEVLDPAETAAAAFEDQPGPERFPTWTLEIFLAASVDPDQVRTLLRPITGDDADFEAAPVAERDWVARSLDGLAPVRAGRFVVHGRHARSDIRANDLALEIEAALAFGTGHHGTTRGCLLAIDRVLKRRRPRRVLDLGTGTGVLAMAVAKALRTRVRCGDLDPVAVDAAAANARANGVAAFVRPVVAAGLRHADLAGHGPYDLVVANILARPLRDIAPAVARNAARGADLVLSGLLPFDVPSVLSAYRTQGFRLERRLLLEGWATLMLRRR